MYYISETISNLNRIFDQNKRQGYLRLDLNENPGGLPEEFIRKTLESVSPEFVSQYPETLEFTESLARFLGTDIQHLCLVNGSSEGIRHIIQAFTAPNGKIVGVVPTYAMFEVYSKMYGRQFCPVPYDENMRMPVDSILQAMKPEVQLLVLLNPNNPVGNVYSREEMSAIMEAAEINQITVLIDEAYFYFYDTTFIEYALNREHVFVTRTFSKLFSLAGCRLGYVVGWPEGIAMVQKLCTPHNVNAFGMLFAQKIIETPGMLESLIEKQKAGKRFLVEELEKHHYEYLGDEGNFLFIKPRTEASRLMDRMKEEKQILVKTYSNLGKMGNCLRVTTGETMYMKLFLDALFELDQ